MGCQTAIRQNAARFCGEVVCEVGFWFSLWFWFCDCHVGLIPFPGVIC